MTGWYVSSPSGDTRVKAGDVFPSISHDIELFAGLQKTLSQNDIVDVSFAKTPFYEAGCVSREVVLSLAKRSAYGVTEGETVTAYAAATLSSDQTGTYTSYTLGDIRLPQESHYVLPISQAGVVTVHDASEDIQLTVGKAEPVGVPEGLKTVYRADGHLSDIVLPRQEEPGKTAGIWSWEDETIVPAVSNNGYRAVFTPDDTERFQSVTRTLSVNVAKGIAPDYDKSVLQGLGIYKGQTLGSLTLPEGFTYAASVDTDRVRSVAGSVEVELIYNPDPDNYNDVTGIMAHVLVRRAAIIEVDPIADQTYTGKAITPRVEVYDGEQLLSVKKDYTIQFKNNKNAGNAEVVVTGKGNYKDVVTVSFAIVPKSLSVDTITASYKNDAFPVKATAQKPLPVVKDGKTTLKAGTDYQADYYRVEGGVVTGSALSEIKEDGRYRVAVTGIGNYAGVRDDLFVELYDTSKTPACKWKVALNRRKLSYTGSPITAETGEGADPTGLVLTVKDGADTLVENVDYTVEYRNNTNCGKAEIVVRSMISGKYAGSRSIAFTIVGTPIKKAVLTGFEKSMVYTGGALHQNITLTDGTKTLVPDVDYTVKETDNVNAGKASLIITGCGAYSGTVKKAYTIKPAMLTVSMLTAFTDTAEQSMTGAKPAMTLTYREKVLVENIDYSVICRNNKAVTIETKKALVTIKGIGNFTGTLKDVKSFTITKKSLSADTIAIDASDLLYNGKKPDRFVYKPKVIVTDGGVKLTEKDCIVSCSGNRQEQLKAVMTENGVPVRSGVITVTVRATKGGSYQGTMVVNAYVTPYSLAKARFTVSDQSYTNTPVVLEGTDITSAIIKLDGKDVPLTYGTDYTIASYQNNGKKGSAKVTLQGIGLYSGTKVVNFKIVPKSMK